MWGGHKRLYRIIDFRGYDKCDIPAKVVSIEYDPYRTAFIALINYSDGDKRYIIAPEDLKVGDTVVSGKGSIPEIGCTLQLNEIPTGTFIHNIELNPGAGAKIVRSAGCYAQLLAKDGDFVSVKLPSGETRLVNSKCLATVGIVSNGNHMNETIGKAGRAIFLSLTRQVIYLIPLALLLPLYFSDPLDGVWWSIPISDALAAITAVIVLLSSRKDLPSDEQFHP